MKILFIGDIFGKPGRKTLEKLLPKLISRHMPHFVIVNIENAAHGSGISRKNIKFFNTCEIDAYTSGNHVMEKKDAPEILQSEFKLLRPANFPDNYPGRGYEIFQAASGMNVAVINLQGIVFMPKFHCPFKTADRIITEIGDRALIRFIDFHAEATSEKKALACYLDGRVTAVVGTHTHVQTADEEVLPGGTAYISDAGMTGPVDSVIGVNKEIIMRRFVQKLPEKFEPAPGPTRLCGVLVDADEKTGLATGIERIREDM